MLVESHHIVERCQWKTQFDDEHQGFQLQEILSYFTNEVMPQIIDKVLTSFCAPQFHWRIERLSLDLGKLDYKDLLKQLPKRFADALYTALWREFQRLPSSAQRQLIVNDSNQQFVDASFILSSEMGHSPVSQVSERQTDSIALLAHFWQFGRLPWWHRQISVTTNQQQLFDQQLTSQSDLVVKLLRRLGMQQAVRQRIAYQYQQRSIKHLIQVLEPSNHQQIIAFADDLQHSSWRKSTVKANASEFAKVRWYWVLTHLLVERGSVFDTKMFILSTLKQMANHYSVDFESLLKHILRLVKLNFAQSTSTNKPLFLIALEHLSKDNQLIEIKAIEQATDVDSHWQKLESLLQQNAYLHRNFTTLFIDLAAIDKPRMASLLRLKAASYRTGIGGFSELLVKALPRNQKYQLIEVLAPSEHLFISTHIAHQLHYFNASGQEENRSSNLLWQVIVAYLLKQSSSYFSREQFVRQTIEALAQKLNISYQQLLSQLQNQVEFSGPISHQLEIAKILVSLRRNVTAMASKPSKKVSLGQVFQRHLTNFIIYLNTGKLSAHSSFSSGQKLWQWLVDSEFSGNAARQLFAVLSKGLHQPLSAIQWLRLNEVMDVNQCQWLILSAGERFNGQLELLLKQINTNQNIHIAGGDKQPWQVLSTINDKLLLSFSLLQALLQKRGQDKTNDFNHLLERWLQVLAIAYGIGEIKQQSQKQISHKDRESQTDQLALLVIQLRQTDKLTVVLASLLHQWPTKRSLSYIQQQKDAHVLMAKLVDIASGSDKVASIVRQFIQSLWPYPSVLLMPWIQAWAQQLVAKADVSMSVNQLIRRLQRAVWLVLLDSRHIDQLAYQSYAKQGVFWQQLLEAISATIDVEYATVLDRLIQLKYRPFAKLKVAIKLENLQVKPQLIKEKEQILGAPNTYKVALQFWLLNGRFPAWLKSANQISSFDLITNLQVKQPMQLFDFIVKMVKQQQRQAHWRSRLYQLLPLNKLLSLLQQHQSLNLLLKSFAQQLLSISESVGLKGVSQSQYRYWLWLFVVDKLLPAIVKHQQGNKMTINGVQLSNGGQLLACLLVDLSTKSHVAPMVIVEQLTEKLDLSRQMLDELNTCIEQQPTTVNESIKPVEMTEPEKQQSYSINNAGLVLFQGFIRPYFARLGLTENDQFCDKNAAVEAVHYLQYLVTGSQQTEEHHLLLNKLLLGLPIDMPLTAGIDMTDEQTTMADGLLDAMISHWGAIGKSSIDGFRGNWLVRNGVLTEDEECWILQVEKRPYDLLLERFPLAFRQIRLPWMDKLLTVEWQS